MLLVHEAVVQIEGSTIVGAFYVPLSQVAWMRGK
jgi:hypothetical protein